MEKPIRISLSQLFISRLQKGNQTFSGDLNDCIFEGQKMHVFYQMIASLKGKKLHLSVQILESITWKNHENLHKDFKKKNYVPDFMTKLF